MSKPHGILIFGANGSGKTTLGRELARRLGYIHMDHEAYHFLESEIPYTAERSKESCISLMLADIEKHLTFVLSAVTGDFGEIIPQYYRLAVFLSAPLELRMKRIAQRECDRHGDRIRAGGDMYEQHNRFLHFAASRSLARIEQWAQTLTCPLLRLDGTVDYHTQAAIIAERYGD